MSAVLVHLLKPATIIQASGAAVFDSHFMTSEVSASFVRGGDVWLASGPSLI